MKSGLEDRNNAQHTARNHTGASVSMKSGLEDRNNIHIDRYSVGFFAPVSMKSGLEDRNNITTATSWNACALRSQ